MCELMCAVALERLGDERAADALLQALADPDWRVLSAAGTGLVRLGDRRAIPPLLRLLDHADRSVRYGVCRDLLNLKAGDQRLVDALERLSQDPEAEEHDLEADEWNCDLEKHRQMAREEGWPEPRPRLRMHELVEQARQLLAQSES